MKKQLTRAFAVFGLMLMSAAFTGAAAQTTRTIFVHVPFEFVVGEKRLPAGDYTIRRILLDSDKTLLIRSIDGRATATVHTSDAGKRAAAPQAKLVFAQYGEQYFLAQVWTPGAETARALSTSRIRRSLEREWADGATRNGGDAAKVRPEEKTVTIVGGVR
ncbi:MAG TPA: hypothetical protein VF064_04785 [Pyrinomonadaceae bacterium]